MVGIIPAVLWDYSDNNTGSSCSFKDENSVHGLVVLPSAWLITELPWRVLSCFRSFLTPQLVA